MRKNELNMAKADDPNEHILWLNRVFFGILYEDPKGKGDEDNRSSLMSEFVLEYLERDNGKYEGMGVQRLIRPEMEGYNKMSDEEKEFARYRNATVLMLKFAQENESIKEVPAWYSKHSLTEWVACGECKHQLFDGDLEWLEKVTQDLLENPDEDLKFDDAIMEEETPENEMTLEEAIVENAVEATPEAEEEVVPETKVEDAIEKALAKAEAKAEAKEAETEEETEEETVEIDSQEEEHIHGPHCNHSVEEITYDVPHMIGAVEEVEWEKVEYTSTGPQDGLVSWAALAAVMQAQEGTEGLIKKSPKFDKALVAALKEMKEAGILRNPRCVLDAIMVMLDVDPRAVVEIEQIFSSTN